MNTILLGAGGMIGNGVYKIFLEENLDFVGTVSDEDQKAYLKDNKLLKFRITPNLLKDTARLVEQLKPKNIVNCIGMIKPADNLVTTKDLYLVNSIFPQVLRRICDVYQVKLIHLSTDCVFSGQKGGYKDTDIPDDNTEYGKSKFLGEISILPHLTIRTSIIGKEVNTKKNLLDWFLNVHKKSVTGYLKARWNGVSSLTMGRIIARLIKKDIDLNMPLIHIAGETVSKYELLTIFKEVFCKEIVIEKNADYINDRTLVPFEEQDRYFDDIIKPIKQQIIELKKYYAI